MTSPEQGTHLTSVESLHVYTSVFAEIGLATLFIAFLMWLSRPWLIKVINQNNSDEEMKIQAETVNA